MRKSPALIHSIGSAHAQTVPDALTILQDRLDEALCMADNLNLPFVAIHICEALNKLERRH